MYWCCQYVLVRFITEIVFHPLEYTVYRSSIGGGGLMTVRIPNPDGKSQVYTVDFHETAPALANSLMFTHNPILTRQGGLAVAVLGEMQGLEEAHRRWGKLPWERLVWLSVRLAQGWEVDRELARQIMVGLISVITTYSTVLILLFSAFFRFVVEHVQLE